MTRSIKTPKIALIGVSGYAREHLNFLLQAQRQGRLQLRAAVTIAPVEEHEQCSALTAAGCRMHGSQEALWAAHRGEIDLVVIPTPIHLHVPMTLAALAAGANVLVEKPLTSDPAAIPLLEEAERRSGRFVAVAFQDLYAGGVWRLKRMLGEGRLGTVRSLKVCGLWPRNDAYYQRNQWAGRSFVDSVPVLDSPLSNAFAHHLNLMLFLAGERPGETASIGRMEAELFRSRRIECYDTAAVRLHAADGKKLLILASHSSREEWSPRVVVGCDGGRAVWNVNDGLQLFDRGGTMTASWPGRDNSGAMEEMYDHVLGRLQSATAFVCSIRLAAAHVQCIAELQRAAGIVDIPDSEIIPTMHAGGPHTTIRGLEEYFHRAFTEGRLLHEVGCPWARRIQPAGTGSA